MAIDDEPDERELAAKRAALYRPGAAPEALQDYLAAQDRAAAERAPALAEQPTSSEPPVPARRRRIAGPLLVVGAVAVFAVAAVAVGVVARGQAVPPAPAETDAPFPPVPGTPIGELVGGAARTAVFDAGGSGAVVALHCSGTGTITVQIADDPVGRYACAEGRNGGIRRSSLELQGRFAVRVTASGSADWALTVGALPRG
ncbi:hypothetical protein [Amnibacterium kyonggiense]|uniref:hypothetical protein n=1 Tax=Amnibacterium kyonggiense TaxID=595671 RepID=UPI00105CCB99|nr:hypothetical protein [Amnibacterium kyonggiense]